MNYWYFLLCSGGDGLREADQMPFLVQAIGMEKAAAIAYHTLNSFLVRESEYLDMCYFSIDAATQLYGEGSPEVVSVKKAWYAVGLLTLDELATGQAGAENKAWKVFPNPGKDALTISNPYVYTEFTVNVTDLSGREILKFNILPGESADMSSLSAGTYLLRIGSDVIRWVKY
jgi:hypothetical protein